MLGSTRKNHTGGRVRGLCACHIVLADLLDLTNSVDQTSGIGGFLAGELCGYDLVAEESKERAALWRRRSCTAASLEARLTKGECSAGASEVAAAVSETTRSGS